MALTTVTMYMFFGLLVFALIVLALIAFMALRTTGGYNEIFFKLAALTIIGSLATALTVAGFSENQMAAALGLLGTIAGYLLGETAKIKRETPAE